MSTVQAEVAALPKMGESNGVLILEVQPGSPAARMGIAAGDRLVSLNRHPINDTSG